MIQSPAFILYFTLGCHLCELAEEIITELNTERNVEYRINYKKCDIADDSSLIEQYGIRIPVLKNTESALELNWPFTLEQLHQFIRAS